MRDFATPLGPATDPRMMDCRNALSRLDRSSVETVLAPLTRGLAPRDRVLLVVPAGFQKAPLRMVLIPARRRPGPATCSATGGWH